MTKPPSRPKGWRRETVQPQAKAASEPAEDVEAEDLPTNAAPGHMGAQVSSHPGYMTGGRGVFGFRQDTW